MRRFGILLFLCLLLTGCFTQQTDTTLRADGSGTNEIRIGFSRQFLDFANMGGGGGQGTIDDLLDQLGGVVDLLPAEWEAASEPWESEDRQFKGTRISMVFRDLPMLQDQLSSQELNEFSSFWRFADVSVTEEEGDLVLRATIEASDSSAGLGDFGSLGAFPGMGQPEASWRITMPAKISEWSERQIAAQEESAVTYTFPIPLDRSYQIEVRSPVGSGVSPVVLAVVGGLLVLGVATILAGLFMSRRNRANRQAAATAPLGTPPPYDVPATSYQTRPLQPIQPPPASPAPGTPWSPPASPPPVSPWSPPPATGERASGSPASAAQGASPDPYDSARPPTRALGSWVTERPSDEPRNPYAGEDSWDRSKD